MNNMSEHTNPLSANSAQNSACDVLRTKDVNFETLCLLLYRYKLQLQQVAGQEPIPGSYWGEEEAGLIGNRLLVRTDTPLHSILHEACHYICMDDHRRQGIHTDAGGDYDEENAVCYLQILLADHIGDPDCAIDRQQMLTDMDRWGYTFRLGSARSWFEQDADDARATLYGWGLIDKQQNPTFQLRRT